MPTPKPSAAFVVDCAHYTVEGMDDTDDLGFFSPVCACGWPCPPCPDQETAADALMQHAYEAGILTERKARSV
jgi:hypothetical protein